MGGLGSGPWGTARYCTVEQSCALEMAWLRSCGVLKTGLIACSTSSWTRRGEVVASIGWRVDTTEPGWEYIELSYTVTQRGHDDEQITDRFTLVTSQPHFGGVRWWFVCACGQRCAKLYNWSTPPSGRPMPTGCCDVPTRSGGVCIPISAGGLLQSLSGCVGQRITGCWTRRNCWRHRRSLPRSSGSGLVT